jgi:hypothetical protein
LDDEEWAEEFEEELGELFGHEFFRVVLDEGHMIRNERSKSLSLSLFHVDRLVFLGISSFLFFSFPFPLSPVLSSLSLILSFSRSNSDHP